MHTTIAWLRTKLRRPSRPATHADSPDACSWDRLRSVYEEQAARGVPEAIRGLEYMEQGRWPSSGRPRR